VTGATSRATSAAVPSWAPGARQAPAGRHGADGAAWWADGSAAQGQADVSQLDPSERVSAHLARLAEVYRVLPPATTASVPIETVFAAPRIKGGSG